MLVMEAWTYAVWIDLRVSGYAPSGRTPFTRLDSNPDWKAVDKVFFILRGPRGAITTLWEGWEAHLALAKYWVADMRALSAPGRIWASA